jgi:hypothetical protein
MRGGGGNHDWVQEGHTPRPLGHRNLGVRLPRAAAFGQVVSGTVVLDHVRVRATV